jgi:hypothetical protein
MMARRLAVGLFVCVAIAGAILGSGNADPSASGPGPAESAALPATDAPPTGLFHSMPRALDAAALAIPLSEAVERAAPGLRLPDPAQAGAPERVMLIGDDTTPRERTGMAIRYPRGIDLTISPGLSEDEFPDYARANKTPNLFADGRAEVIEFVTAGEVQIAVQKGGALKYADGSEDTMLAAVSWRMGSTKYVLLSDPGDSNVSRVLAIARSMCSAPK